ncbi:MAG: DUF3604 domain-containing protein [Rhizobiaceae bacterium MnEN-MB40S]|nr:MAG: DUF3604 domain-containing protein [Rhizobiaceae bacterium MnEN-MB40S]
MPYSTYRPDLMGSARLEAPAEIVAGSMQELVLTYRCGEFGVDDTGSIKIGFRFATDMGQVQFDDPTAAGFTTAEASNGAPLQLKWEFKRNIRPWSRSLYVGVSGDYLSPGDTITIRFGDRRHGSPGIRMQTYCESEFEFRVFVDAIATYDYVALPESPKVSIIPGPPVHWKAVLPTLVKTGEPFALGLKGEDRWRNPSRLDGMRFAIKPNAAFDGLPASIEASPGGRSIRVEGLSLASPGEHALEIAVEGAEAPFQTNPIRAEADPEFLHAWGDTHGQSNETLGTNDAAEYFTFGRDLAFLDVIGHQGNDFQITDEFWADLNATTRAFDKPGRFVCFPGYEWSANTAVGGDRNVHYLNEGEPIYRSSHAQIESLKTEPDDAWTADDLFARLDPDKCVVAAHVGGRYADIVHSHDARLETAVEVHSSWGTFEWIVEDAFRQGYRVGIVANSDGHKGRPGACYPGASFFGSMGGLTCFLTSETSRPAIFDAMKKRRHYGTTGARIYLNTEAHFDAPVRYFDGDPGGGAESAGATNVALMGAIVETDQESLRYVVNLTGSAPLERVDLFDGLDCLETIRPWTMDKPSRRLRIVYEGAASRGRSRAMLWNGEITLDGNTIEKTQLLNNWNLDRGISDQSPSGLKWSAVTTGNYGAIDLWLDKASTGHVKVRTSFCNADLDLGGWDGSEIRIDAGGLGSGMRLYALPETMSETRLDIERLITTPKGAERRLYVRVQQEDGHRAWASPTYVMSV